MDITAETLGGSILQLEDKVFPVQTVLDISRKIKQPFGPVEQKVYLLANTLEAETGIVAEQWNYFIATIMTFVLSISLQFVHGTSARKMFSTLGGLFVGFYIYGVGFLLIIFQFLIVFPILKYFPRRVASRFSTIVAATILICVAIYNMNHDLLGHTCHIGLMINFIKIHMVACSHGDTRTIPDPHWKSWFTPREIYYA